MTIDPYDPRLQSRNLTWADVDPDRHPFDPATALDTVRALAPAGGVPIPIGTTPRAATVRPRRTRAGTGSGS
ncbi:hypothetical protein [Actinoplanes palleronii]|uniref:Uncharacterized protein n=1 Tax=Actinoplanes palleronii TaxID=113570 RepID=A0ABQ4BC43_9ACTN|nr:hypothetical protein [Actinoplanes palleronii]GIE68269.1 hypothetical protein Apa02nite_043770 [Actinoplanes palleronii]